MYIVKYNISKIHIFYRTMSLLLERLKFSSNETEEVTTYPVTVYWFQCSHCCADTYNITTLTCTRTIIFKLICVDHICCFIVNVHNNTLQRVQDQNEWVCELLALYILIENKETRFTFNYIWLLPNETQILF